MESAVEWLIEKIKIKYDIDFYHIKKDIEQTKEMEKQQRQKDFKAGNDSACMEHENIEDYFKKYIKSE
jgi:hypothetical protein